MRAHLAALGLLLLAGCVTVNAPSGVQMRSEPKERAAPDLKEAARINTDLGINYARNGDFDVALDKFGRALEQDPSHGAAHAGIALVYSQRGETEAAEAHFKRALQLQAGDAFTRNNYGVLLCGQKRYKEAERMFQQAATSVGNRTPESAYTNAGVCAQRVPDLDRAEAYLREALKVKPEYPDALQNLATVYFERGDYPRARSLLQRYEKVGPASASSLWLGAKIEFALGDQSAAANYVQRLQTQFPDSEESTRTLSSPAS